MENLEKERKAKLNDERIFAIRTLVTLVPMGLNFGEISDEDIYQDINGARLQFEQQQKRGKGSGSRRIKMLKFKIHTTKEKRSYFEVWQFVPVGFKSLNMGLATDMEFRSILDEANEAKKTFETEQAKIEEMIVLQKKIRFRSKGKKR